MFAVSLYVLLRAKTLRELDELTRRVEEQLDALLVPRNLDTSALAATLPFVGPSLAMDTGMLVGVARVGQTPVLLDPFDRSLDNANLAVVAPAGAGKSFFCKLLAMRQLVNGSDCIVIDPEDEYRALAEAVAARWSTWPRHLPIDSIHLTCRLRPAHRRLEVAHSPKRGTRTRWPSESPRCSDSWKSCCAATAARREPQER